MSEPTTYWNGNDLLAARFPAPRYAVQGIISEGVNVLAGAPKLGKSWFALGIALAIAHGGYALGKIRVDPGEALVLSLEDTGRRLQSRLGMMLDGERPGLGGLHLHTDWPRAGVGGLARLDAWLGERSAIRIVVVDVLARFRDLGSDTGSAYLQDYAAVSGLKQLADRHGVCVLIVHHDRKAGADDWLDRVSGTHGIAGAADALLLLDRGRGEADGQLHVTGRDVDESSYGLKFDKTRGLWTMLGDAAEWVRTPEEREVLVLLDEHGSLTPIRLSELVEGLTHEAAKKRLQRMSGRELIDPNSTGTYRARKTPSPPVPAVPLSLIEGDSQGHGDTRDTGRGGAR